MHRSHSEHAGDEGGGWIWSTPEPSGNGQRISTAELIFNIFFLQEIVQGRLWAHKIGPCGRVSANGRNVLSAKHLTQASVQLPSKHGTKNGYGHADSGRGEERFSCKESDTFSATKPVAAGFDA